MAGSRGGRSNVPEAVVRFVGRQIGVDSSELNLYEWSGRTIEYHHAQIRTHLGFRVATVDDQEKLTTCFLERSRLVCPSTFPVPPPACLVLGEQLHAVRTQFTGG